MTERDSYARSVSSTQDSSVSVLKQLETARKENLAFAAQVRILVLFYPVIFYLTTPR